MYFLGIDGGTFKTKAVVGDQSGRILGKGLAGSSNYQMIGLEPAMEAVVAAADQALDESGLSLSSIKGAVFGLSGADLPINFSELNEGLQLAFPGLSFQLLNDAWVGLRGGTRSGLGVAVVCGTGGNICGLNDRGERYISRGLGYETGFFGGSMHLVREIIHHAFRSAESIGPKTLLEAELLQLPGVESFDRLASLILESQSNPLAVAPLLFQAFSLVPRLFQLAAEGDLVSQEIITRLGRFLGRSAGYLCRKLKLNRCDVVLIGSIFPESNPFFLDSLNLELHLLAPEALTCLPLFSPETGAYLLSLEKEGIIITEEIYQRLMPTATG